MEDLMIWRPKIHGSMQNNFVVLEDYPNNKVNSLFISDRICTGRDFTSTC